MSSERRLLETHPHWPAAKTVIDVLRENGFQALLAGGCVRDALRGVIAKDLDIATSAKPEDIARLFDKTVDVGKSFGVMRVLVNDADLEVATFRGDGDYKDGRRPETVHFTDEKEDALRRDFTVNALFFDIADDRVHDFVNGRADLAAKTLRTVGEPERRFEEDHLRLLRAARFAVQLDFEIEPNTWRAVKNKAADVKTVSRERVRDELVKMLMAGGKDRGPRLLRESGLLLALFPRLAGFEKNMEAAAVRNLHPSSPSATEALCRWLTPLAESGAQGLQAAKDVLSSLRLSKSDEQFVRRCLETIFKRDEFWTQASGRRLNEYSEAAVRLACSIWDGCGSDPRHEALKKEWERIAPAGRLPERVLRGDDLHGKVQGARLGEALTAAFEAQLEGRFADKAAALTWVDRWLKLNE